ncbi:MAG: SusC/RagA family TonB-linked outer membrane protein, partial [Bacteroidota bacterium]
MKKIRLIKSSQRLLWLSLLGGLTMSNYSSHAKVNEKDFTLIRSFSKLNQVNKIGGKVISAKDASPVIGASVFVKESPNVGTSTDAEGNFNLTLPDVLATKKITLVVSSVGFEKFEVTVSAGQSAMVVTLKESLQQLGEIVVTALGVKKDKRALAYSVSEINGSDFTQARENNVANALTGKIAGVNATGLSTGPGGSSRVVIRGNGSLTGNSQPLYVINGMPIDNSVPGGSSLPNGLGTKSGTDRGDGISAINPDDIETMTVLKGGAAAALYGSRGANGVILITTKKGKGQKGIGVEYNSTYTMENISVFPDFQYEYGQGDGGVKPTTLAQAQGTGRRSFGSKIDGSTDYVAADGKTHPYLAQKDNLKNFYQTGTTFTNSIALSGGNDAVNYRLSLADMDAKSVLPTNTYNRKTANLNISAKLSERLRAEAVVQYNLEQGNNRPIAGDALGNPNWMAYEVANTVDVRWLNPGYDANGNEIFWNDAGIVTNGYFFTNKFKETDTKDRFIGQASISYDLLKNLTVKATTTRDFYNYNFTSIMPTGGQYLPQGQYDGIKADVSETNSMITAAYNTKFGGTIGLSVLGGGNTRQFKNNEIDFLGQEYTIPYFYSYSNLATSSATPITSNIKTNSVFGSADLDYKGIWFLTLTGRQDWFSTLSPKNNNVFYPSIGTSLILSDVITMPQIFDQVKLRGSWAQVGGGGPDPYAINLAYSNVPSASSVPLQNVSSVSITNAELKPFTSTTFELGLSTRLFKGRLNLDVALYDKKSTNDIVSVPISGASGYTSAILNSGQLSNKGIEILLEATPFKTANFTWNTSFNFAYNKSEVLKLADGINTFSIGNSANGNAFINNQVGMPFGGIYGYRMKKDAAGNIIYDTNSNLPLQTDNNQFLGNGVPPYTMGLTNTFKYKNFSLDVLIDGKFGSSVFSVMEVYATRLGLLKSTLPGRENGLALKGVTASGDAYSYTVP